MYTYFVHNPNEFVRPVHLPIEPPQQWHHLAQQIHILLGFVTWMLTHVHICVWIQCFDPTQTHPQCHPIQLYQCHRHSCCCPNQKRHPNLLQKHFHRGRALNGGRRCPHDVLATTGLDDVLRAWISCVKTIRLSWRCVLIYHLHHQRRQ